MFLRWSGFSSLLVADLGGSGDLRDTSGCSLVMVIPRLLGNDGMLLCFSLLTVISRPLGNDDMMLCLRC